MTDLTLYKELIETSYIRKVRQVNGTVRLKGIPMSYFGEMMLIWEGNKLG